MNNWTAADLRRLDIEYAEAGVDLHQRPLTAAMDLLGLTFSMGSFGNPEVAQIIQAYRRLIPEVDDNWPGAGIGLLASVDRVRKVVLPIVFGSQPLDVWQMASFASVTEWNSWCREDEQIGAQMAFATADLCDFTSGLDELKQGDAEAVTLWRMARSNLEDVANILSSSFTHDSVLQPIFMVAELSLKASLVWNGQTTKSLKSGGGHDLTALAQRLATVCPHRDDVRVQQVITALPPYVGSRYQPAGLKRINVVRLALGIQFLAASTVRRLTTCDIAAEMEADGWPGERSPFAL